MGLVESAWFFRRGNEYVRIVRVGGPTQLSLLVDGPANAHAAHHFEDAMACAIHQCELERQLVTRNFHLERASGMRAVTVPVLTMPVSAEFPGGPAAA